MNGGGLSRNVSGGFGKKYPEASLWWKLFDIRREMGSFVGFNNFNFSFVFASLERDVEV